jgi:hypothetical protein
MKRRIIHLIKVQQVREHVQIKSQDHQERMKEILDKRTKEKNLMEGYLDLKWDSIREEKQKHGKFYNL